MPSARTLTPRAALPRRRLLAAVAGGLSLALSGCLGPVSPGESPGSDATDRRSTTSTDDRSAADCTATDLPRHSSGPSYPSLPSAVSAATALDFAYGFEEAYGRNRFRILDGPVTYLEVVSTAATEPESVDGGVLVGVELRFEYGYEDHTSTATATVENTEYERVVAASYLVSAARALRVETDALRAADPRESPAGETVACAD